MRSTTTGCYPNPIVAFRLRSALHLVPGILRQRMELRREAGQHGLRPPPIVAFWHRLDFKTLGPPYAASVWYTAQEPRRAITTCSMTLVLAVRAPILSCLSCLTCLTCLSGAKRPMSPGSGNLCQHLALHSKRTGSHRSRSPEQSPSTGTTRDLSSRHRIHTPRKIAEST